MGGARGRKLNLEQRKEVIALIDRACADGARLEQACAVLELSPRTLQRWREGGEVKGDGRQAAARERIPANRLKEEERQRLLEVVNSPEFASKAPSQIVPALADRGEYLASESTIYRYLRETKQLAHRGRAAAPTHSRPRSLVATGPNQVWSWDITYLATTLAGIFFYLYMALDIFSRKIVGWEVHAEQSDKHAAELFRRTHLREGVKGEVVLHSDNGSPMKGATLLVTLQRLNVIPSFSRPSVSNDNPYSEALFKTCKYHPAFPEKPFEDVDLARKWVDSFVHWYNEEHHHSGIHFVTPGQRHRGEDIAILEQRKTVYEAARTRQPARWSGDIRNWDRIESVSLNPTKSTTDKEEKTTHNQA